MEEKLKEIVFFISEEIGERNFWKYEDLKKCAEYIKDLLSKNYKVNVLSYKIYDKEFENIYVIKEGKREDFIVIGSHYDSVVGSKGADDNASGVGVNLLISDFLKYESLNYGIIFSFFPNEEPPFFKTDLMGSYLFAKFLRREKFKIEGMICLESVGYFSSKKNSQNYPFFLNLKYPDKGDFIGVVGNLKSKKLVKDLSCAIKKYSRINCEYLYALPALIPGIDFSDNWSFYKNGFKACMVTDTGFYRNPYYHTNLDSYQKLDYGRMKEIVIGISKFLKNI